MIRRCICYLMLLLCGMPFGLHAQERTYSFSSESDRYFSDQTYDSLFRQYAREAALSIGAPAENAINAFESGEQEILSDLRPALGADFQRIEKKISKPAPSGTRAYKRQLETYRQSIRRQIIRVIQQNPSLRTALRRVNQQDRILHFDQTIQVQENGALLVVEEISIYNGKDEQNNNPIKRGITRDFPTVYYNQLGLRHLIPFSLRSVKRNGENEAYHTEKLRNGMRIFLGSADQFLSTGIHHYRIEYQTNHQLIFHENKDELYWNVNGTGWLLSTEKVSCRIRFPESCRILEQTCYTGAQGSTSRDCHTNLLGANELSFRSKKPFAPGEGLTIAVAVKKGVFKEAAHSKQWLQLAKDNGIFTAGILAVLLTLVINWLVWLRLGRDPQKGIIIPQFEPPAGFSPADLGYAFSQQYSPHLFSAAILDMAVKQCLEIEVDQEGLLIKRPTYSFLKRNEHKEEQNHFSKTYGFDTDDLHQQKAKKGSYNAKIASAYSALERTLKERVEASEKKSGFHIFSKNDQYLGLSILFWVFFVIATVSWIGIFHSPVAFMLSMGGLILLGILIQVVFAKIMSAYTAHGRKIADHIEGFRLYLSTTEKSVYELLNPPEENLQLFEKFLPYAVALGIENTWAERFKNQLEPTEGNRYRPSYYRFHSTGGFQSGEMASSLANGLSSTIASATSPPSSSSGGSSGGGFSGGGGGGGGGGGW